jgi:hypothetical protein
MTQSWKQIGYRPGDTRRVYRSRAIGSCRMANYADITAYLDCTREQPKSGVYLASGVRRLRCMNFNWASRDLSNSSPELDVLQMVRFRIHYWRQDRDGTELARRLFRPSTFRRGCAAALPEARHFRLLPGGASATTRDLLLKRSSLNTCFRGPT